MATQSQIDANRRNAEKSTGPKTDEGKARSSRNRLSHGFAASNFVLPTENHDDFKLLLQDLHAEYRPATPTEQIFVEKMAQNQWLSLRAYRLQALALAVTVPHGTIHKDLGLLIRYHQSSDRAFYRARTELLKAQKERKSSEIGFEPQTAGQPAPDADLIIPDPPSMPRFMSLKDQVTEVMNAPLEELAKLTGEMLRAEDQAA